MKLGVMNHPGKDVLEEIAWIGENHFDFVDLTLEPTHAQPKDIKIEQVLKLLKKYNLEIVGHTCYYLPYASEIKRLRKASIEELKEYLSFFAKLGVKMVTVHTDGGYKEYYDKFSLIKRNAQGLNELAIHGGKHGMEIMLENQPGGLLLQPEDVEEILSLAPEIRFQLDIGHAFIAGEGALEKFLKGLKGKLVHVHVSDNKGFSDEHLPIGAGRINWQKTIRLLKRYKYDNTITLEIFSQDRDYLLYCRDKFLKLWQSLLGSGFEFGFLKP